MSNLQQDRYFPLTSIDFVKIWFDDFLVKIFHKKYLTIDYLDLTDLYGEIF